MDDETEELQARLLVETDIAAAARILQQIDFLPQPEFDNTGFPFVGFNFQNQMIVTLEFNGEANPDDVRVLSASARDESDNIIFRLSNVEIPISGPFTNLFLRAVPQVHVIQLRDTDLVADAEATGDVIVVDDWMALLEAWAEPEPSIDVADVIAGFLTIDMGTAVFGPDSAPESVLRSFDVLEIDRTLDAFDEPGNFILDYSVERRTRDADAAGQGSTGHQSASTDDFVDVVILTTATGAIEFVDLEEMAFTDGSLLFGRSESADSVYRIYNASLDRTPDKPGFVFWDRFADNLGLGPARTDKALAEVFVGSVEFAEKFLGDGSDEAYVGALYSNVLDRDADDDPGGRDFWLGAFQSGRLDRADMLVAFANSAENVAAVADDIENGYWVLNV